MKILIIPPVILLIVVQAFPVTAQYGGNHNIGYRRHQYARYDLPRFELRLPDSFDAGMFDEHFFHSIQDSHSFEPFNFHPVIHFPDIYLPQDDYIRRDFPYYRDEPEPPIVPFRCRLRTAISMSFKVKTLMPRDNDDKSATGTDGTGTVIIVKPEGADAKPKEADAKPKETDAKPKETDAKPPKETDVKPKETNSKPKDTDSKPETKPEGIVTKPEATDSKPEGTVNQSEEKVTKQEEKASEVTDPKAEETATKPEESSTNQEKPKIDTDINAGPNPNTEASTTPEAAVPTNPEVVTNTKNENKTTDEITNPQLGLPTDNVVKASPTDTDGKVEAGVIENGDAKVVSDGASA